MKSCKTEKLARKSVSDIKHHCTCRFFSTSPACSVQGLGQFWQQYCFHKQQVQYITNDLLIKIIFAYYVVFK